ncbi:MAG: hypothetical protein JO249_03460 [Acidobacteria bacterium]|nr:hypothetical protein [Acidobacteriota bacterium]MBV9479797.1 hypothetical protein [Acidobacteriota bacterium]
MATSIRDGNIPENIRFLFAGTIVLPKDKIVKNAGKNHLVVVETNWRGNSSGERNISNTKMRHMGKRIRDRPASFVIIGTCSWASLDL